MGYKDLNRKDRQTYANFRKEALALLSYKDEGMRGYAFFYLEAMERLTGEPEWRLAILYYEGWGCRKCYKEAWKRLEWHEGCQDPDYLYYAGSCLFHGHGAKKDRGKGFAYLLKAAKKGHAKSAMACAECYIRGIYVPKDIHKGVRMLTIACKAGDEKALSIYPPDGYPTPNLFLEVSPARLERIVKKADAGDGESQFLAGVCYRYGLGCGYPRYGEAAFYLQQASEQGNGEATELLAEMVSLGKGFESDHDEAHRLALKAVEQGSPFAEYDLGCDYVNGTGVRIDHEKAIAHFRKAAKNGIPGGFYGLGLIFREGFGVKQDPWKAFEYFKKAARLGHVDAMKDLSGLYATGSGCGKDLKKAYRWYGEAASLGDVKSLYMVALYLYEGKGVPKDEGQAKELLDEVFEKASEKGQSELASMALALSEKIAFSEFKKE